MNKYARLEAMTRKDMRKHVIKIGDTLEYGESSIKDSELKQLVRNQTLNAYQLAATLVEIDDHIYTMTRDILVPTVASLEQSTQEVLVKGVYL